MCWYAVKKLLTHASAVIINRHTAYLSPCRTNTGYTAWRLPHVASQDLSGPSRHCLSPGMQQISAAQLIHGIPVNSTLSISMSGQSQVFCMCVHYYSCNYNNNNNRRFSPFRPWPQSNRWFRKPMWNNASLPASLTGGPALQLSCSPPNWTSANPDNCVFNI